MPNRIAAGFLVVLLASGAALADTPPSTQDANFLVKTARGAEHELAIAKLAREKATRPDVKSYAEMIISGHESANSQLHDVARKNGVTIPSGMTRSQQADVHRLAGLQGGDFDRAYVKDETRINQRDEKLEKAEIASTSNAQIKSFVQSLQADDAKHAAAGKTLELSGQ